MTHSRLDHYFLQVLRVAAFGLWMLLLVVGSASAQGYVIHEASLDGGGGGVAKNDLTLISSLSSIPVGTVSTDRYVLYSAFPSPFSGQAAILIIHDPSGSQAVAGRREGIIARIITNNAPLSSATLYYRSGTSTDAVAVPMTQDQDGFVGLIPGSDVGAAGLTYFFTAEDEEGTTVRAPRQGVYSLPIRMGSEELERPGGQPGGDTQSAYRLLSIPIDLDDGSPQVVLGDDIPTLANASSYDPAVARLFEPIGTRVAEFPGTGDFELGRAFWLIVRDEVETIDAGEGTVKPLNEEVEIALSQGWNFVGTPFTQNIPIENLQLESGGEPVLRSYGSNGYNTPDNPVTEMVPFEGYAVFAEAATTLIVKPPLLETEKALRTRAKSDEKESIFPWRLRIRGTSGSGWDADNVAAIHPGAANGWDAHDWPEPPSLGSGLRIAFDSPENAPGTVPLSADVRTPVTQGATWPLTVEMDASGPVRLSIDGVQQVPATFEAWLVDVNTKSTWNLRSSPVARLDVLGEGAVRPMRLVVGTKTYVRDALQDMEALPLEYVLNPPYPNPSSGPIAFQLGLPDDERVTLEVYNILGQRLAVLKDGEEMPAGFHTVVWDAPRLASGMYFVRMEAGSYRKAQKMVRIR